MIEQGERPVLRDRRGSGTTASSIRATRARSSRSRCRPRTIGHRSAARRRAACSGIDRSQAARRQPRRDRAARDAHRARDGHRDRRRVLRRRRRRAVRPVRRRGRADRAGAGARVATCAIDRDPRRGAHAPAPTRSTPATASCRRTPRSPRPSPTPGSSSSARRRDVIRKLGSKSAAKVLAQTAGVPVVPGYEPQARWRDAAIGYPAADQGERGRRRQGHAASCAARASSPRRSRGAQREAKSAFGDDTRPARALRRARRATSRSRSSATRTATSSTCASASARSSAATRRSSRRRRRPRSTSSARRDGRGRGRARPRDRLRRRRHGRVHASTTTAAFYFLEVNTRLQVEHPVTERSPGSISSSEQLRSRAASRSATRRATAAPGPRHRGPAVRRGSGRDYLPTTGTLRAFDFPDCRLRTASTPTPASSRAARSASTTTR